MHRKMYVAYICTKIHTHTLSLKLDAILLNEQMERWWKLHRYFQTRWKLQIRIILYTCEWVVFVCLLKFSLNEYFNSIASALALATCFVYVRVTVSIEIYSTTVNCTQNVTNCNFHLHFGLKHSTKTSNAHWQITN